MDTFCGAAPDKSDLFGGEAEDTFRHPDPAAAEDDDEDILVVREGVVEFVESFVFFYETIRRPPLRVHVPRLYSTYFWVTLESKTSISLKREKNIKS